MKPRPVVRFDGKEYPSGSDAARDMSLSVSAILGAAQYTKYGVCRKAGGFQWAYADEVPEVWPKKQLIKRKLPAPKTVKFEPDPLAEGPIYSPSFTEIKWQIIPGEWQYEVSTLRGVRLVGERSLMPRIDRQGVSLVRIRDRLYSIVDLMMLAFVGPKPYGYTVQRLEGESEVLSNLCYAPRKPRKSWRPGMTHQEIMNQLKEQLRGQRDES